MTWTRVATAAVLMPIVIALILLGTNTVVATSVAILSVVLLWEYFGLGDAIGHRAYRFWTSFCALLLVAGQWRLGQPFRSLETSAGFSGVNPAHVIPDYHGLTIALTSPFLLFFVFMLGIMARTLWTRRPIVEALPAAGISSSALLLVAFPLSFAVRLHSLPEVGPKLLLFACVITWTADTAAYFVGRAIGRHPLAPHLSPKKTWEGSIGSLFGSLLVGYAFSYWIPIPLVHLLVMAALGNIAGQMGDLLESAYKRSAGVKDSSGLLPGHGGFLDRMDALILCIPVVWYYLVLVNPPLSR